MDEAFEFLERSVAEKFDRERVLRDSPRGSVVLLRHRESGGRFILRRFSGSGEVCRRLLPMRCPNLPQIYEVAEQDGAVLVLEEFITGNGLDTLLEGGTLPPAAVKRTAQQVCAALHVLHSVGAVHRDVKPDNIIM